MKFENREFRAERLELDGNEYVGCTFKSCTLVYKASGPFTLSNNRIIDGSNFEFSGAAGDTVNFMRAIWQMGDAGRALILATFEQIAPGFRQRPN